MVIISVYVWASTVFIDEMNYTERAYSILEYEPNIIDWKYANVTLVKLGNEPCLTLNISSARINRYLLFLNGGYAVKVKIRTSMSNISGPSVLYFNPITKQLIGMAPQMQIRFFNSNGVGNFL